MKTLSGILIFVLSLYFAGYSTQTGGGPPLALNPACLKTPGKAVLL